MITITNYDTGQTLEIVPSLMEWSLQDVSAADSGRDTRGTMHKNRVSQKVKLTLEFNGIEWRRASTIIQAVDSEYFAVTYPDAKSGTMETRTFYRGDVTTPVWMWWDKEARKIYSKVAFNVIER